MGKIDFGTAFSQGWQSFSKNIVNLIIGYFVMALLSITVILVPIMYAGFYKMVLKAYRGETVQVNDVFSGFSEFGRYFVGGLILLGLMIVGILVCGIGIIPVSGLMLFFFPLMVDKGLSGGEALGRCWEYFKSDWLMAIVLAVVTGFIASAGSYVLGIGVLFTGPFAVAVTVAAYEQVFGSPAAPTAVPAVPPAT
jgi:hypothetical protein